MNDDWKERNEFLNQIEKTKQNHIGNLRLAEAESVKNAGELLELYIKSYEARYHIKPVLSTLGIEFSILKNLAGQMDLKTLSELVKHYLTMNNDWFLTKGHDLDTFKKQINVINISYTGAGQIELTGDAKPVYYVGLTEVGRPIASHNPNALKCQTKFKPVIQETWIKQSIEEKLQFTKTQWEETGMDVDQWINNWREWGFLTLRVN